MKTYIHPDDIALFTEVSAAMRVVAKKYELPLRGISLTTNPSYNTAALGTCSAGGHIKLTMRGKTDGQWDPSPRRREDVWRTAAHELAHLRHFNHSPQFQEFEEELIQAMTNQLPNPQDEVISRIVKMQRAKDGEAALGNTAMAENIAAAINRMLLEYELNPSDIDYASGQGRDPVIELRIDRAKFGIEKKTRRVAWQETLAAIVARNHLCTFLIVPGSNTIVFVGTKAHATVAEHAYGTLVPAAALLSRKEWRLYRRQCKREGNRSKAYGFREAWLTAFVRRIGERLQEERARIAQEDTVKRQERGEATPEGQALIRLNNALRRAEEYVDAKFKKKRRYASALRGRNGGHDVGSRMGREAANAMPLGRRGLESSTGPKLLM